MPVTRVRLAAQVRAFTPEAIAVLREVAATVLPPSIGQDKVSHIVDRFVAWGRDYEEGVALAHGYGDPTAREVWALAGAGLRGAAGRNRRGGTRARGGAFATLPLETRRPC